MRKRILSILAAAAAFGLTQTASAVVIWDNGPLSTGSVTRSGVAAPVGSLWSELAVGNTSAGASVHNTGTTGFRLADDFTLSAAGTLNTLTAFAYVTGSAPTALFTNGNIQIWNGRPGDVGSSVVFGDTTTNRISGSAATNMFRTFGSTAAPGGTASVPGTTRTIKTAVFNLGGLSLPAGTYWADYQITPLTVGGTIFHPTTTYPNETRNLLTDNARQLVLTGLWTDLLDTGNPAALADVPLDLAFQVDGTLVPEPTTALIALIAAVPCIRRRR